MTVHLTKECVDIIRRARNVAERMGSVAHDLPWAIDYSHSLIELLNSVERNVNGNLPSVSKLSSTARKCLDGKTCPQLFSIVSKALAAGLGEDEAAAAKSSALLESVLDARKRTKRTA